MRRREPKVYLICRERSHSECLPGGKLAAARAGVGRIGEVETQDERAAGEQPNPSARADAAQPAGKREGVELD